MVVTSPSLASSQKSMPCARQNALVHTEHDLDLDRGSGGREARSALNKMARRSCEEDTNSVSGPRGMMVLFLKQVHLQNVGAAGMCLLAIEGKGMVGRIVHDAETMVSIIPIRSIKSETRAIVTADSKITPSYCGYYDEAVKIDGRTL